jgi:hypothetical protein
MAGRAGKAVCGLYEAQPGAIRWPSPQRCGGVNKPRKGAAPSECSTHSGTNPWRDNSGINFDRKKYQAEYSHDYCQYFITARGEA